MSRSRNIVMMLVALLGAVLLWLYVVTFVTPEDTKRINSIPININGVKYLQDNDLRIMSQDITTIAVEYRTSRVNFSKLTADTIRVSADASWIEEPGVYELECVVDPPEAIKNEVVLTQQKPEKVTITVAKLARKTLSEITLKWGGAVKEGYLMEAPVFEPMEISLVGPESEVSQVAQAIVYYEDVSNLEDTVMETLPVTFLNELGEEVQLTEATSVTPTEVTMTLPVYRTKKLTLALDILEGGGIKEENVEIEITPETIWVKGSDEDLDQLEDVFIIGSLDLSDVKDMAEQEQRTYPLNLPAGISNTIHETDAVVTIRINGVKRETINISDIRLVKPPSDYNYQSFTTSVPVAVRGSEEDIQRILEDASNGIYIRVDLTEYTDTGVYLIPAEVVSEKYPDIAAVEPVSIGVVVSEPEPEPEPSTEAPTENEG